ncbi:Ribonuclease HII [Methanonatronarchaeum thermophilum]|uniref:Ribonuclease HII n=1 Tax=Methanonatronarchaeum thermophilum TaxID=1927129 RepID=A0A1Y3GGR7_9EURY|nr:ribonuclease HII [Methanonatronarchaeum thermophilum]OUJ19513.1 Ribonuclease HII [Methanonatronarchaeum thermophilum]
MIVVGVDEAGKGPVLGPMVVAAVVVRHGGGFKESPSVFRGLGLRDSKKLGRGVRERLECEIKEKAVEYNVVSVSADQIDELRRVMTMNDVMVKAFSKVLEPLDFEVALLDAADVNEDRFARNIKKELGSSREFHALHGADDAYPIVSAASILAKVERDREIKKLEDRVKMKVGTGYPHDKRTINFIERYLKKNGELPPSTRKSWKTAKRLINKQKQSNLGDYND